MNDWIVMDARHNTFQHLQQLLCDSLETIGINVGVHVTSGMRTLIRLSRILTNRYYSQPADNTAQLLQRTENKLVTQQPPCGAYSCPLFLFRKILPWELAQQTDIIHTREEEENKHRQVHHHLHRGRSDLLGGGDFFPNCVYSALYIIVMNI